MSFVSAKAVNPLTLMATGAGTLPFKAPEIFSASKSDSPAADVWSLGVTLLPAIGSSSREQAAQLVKAACAKAAIGALASAAEILEEALTLDPSLRSTHESRVRL